MSNLDIFERITIFTIFWIASAISTFDLKHSLYYVLCVFSSPVLAGPLITVPDEEKREP